MSRPESVTRIIETSHVRLDLCGEAEETGDSSWTRNLLRQLNAGRKGRIGRRTLYLVCVQNRWQQIEAA